MELKFQNIAIQVFKSEKHGLVVDSRSFISGLHTSETTYAKKMHTPLLQANLVHTIQPSKIGHKTTKNRIQNYYSLASVKLANDILATGQSVAFLYFMKNKVSDMFESGLAVKQLPDAAPFTLSPEKGEAQEPEATVEKKKEENKTEPESKEKFGLNRASLLNMMYLIARVPEEDIRIGFVDELREWL